MSKGFSELLGQSNRERLRLQNEFAAATVEYTAAFLALVAHDLEPVRFEAKIADVRVRQKRTMDALLKHIKQRGS
jgi:hypothetical protein